MQSLRRSALNYSSHDLKSISAVTPPMVISTTGSLPVVELSSILFPRRTVATASSITAPVLCQTKAVFRQMSQPRGHQKQTQQESKSRQTRYPFCSPVVLGFWTLSCFSLISINLIILNGFCFHGNAYFKHEFQLLQLVEFGNFNSRVLGLASN